MNINSNSSSNTHNADNIVNHHYTDGEKDPLGCFNKQHASYQTLITDISTLLHDSMCMMKY